MTRSFPRCASLCRDGSQCGRRVTDSSNPPVCHIHSRQSALTAPAPFDANDKLLKIAANDKHPQQLQALKLLRERDTCTVCAANADNQRQIEDVLRHANDEQRSALLVVWSTYSAIKNDVCAQIPSAAAPRQL